MPRSGPITMTFPPFEGMVRRLILANLGVYFAFAVLLWLTPGLAGFLLGHLMLQPLAVAHGEIWQLASYSFLNLSILGILFSMLMLWFFGSMLEGTYGSRWFAELYFTCVIGGAFVSSVVSFTHILHLSPDSVAAGASAALFGVLVAIAMRLGETEFMLWFVVRIRAKYLVAIYILIDMAMLLKDANAFGALLHLSGGLCGYLYVRYAPRGGWAFGVSEQYFGIRNAWYRAKRRRAARKFEVYMGKQGRKVHFDKDGRYLDPDASGRDIDARKKPNSNENRWMN